MAEIDTTQDKRCRGRPQLRPDDETRRIIYEAARHEFAGNGFAATSIETVARRAGAWRGGWGGCVSRGPRRGRWGRAAVRPYSCGVARSGEFGSVEQIMRCGAAASP